MQRPSEEDRLVQVTGGCMAPRIHAGAWVQVDPDRSARPGDVVLARTAASLVVKELHEWGGKRWLVALQTVEPIAVEPPVEILGVVTMVMQPP